jgi:hypothetical protein
MTGLASEGEHVRVTEDEADAFAVACPESKCWAGPGGFCKTPSGARRRPHADRVAKADREGLTGGRGRVVLAGQRLTRDDGAGLTVSGVELVLPARQGGC